jgi:LCP family protein required for cell wall assembly
MGACGAVGGGIAVLGKFQHTGIVETMSNLPAQIGILTNPRQFFPGQDRITILCLGLDRNIVKSRDVLVNGQPTTKGARSDVIMVASLDLANQQVSVLSIPRDTLVDLPGRHAKFKINQAQADGGIKASQRTVEQFLGIHLDHHIIIKQEAIEKVVDAIGGLDLKVEKDMDYDDHWGQLFVHLKEGQQHLDGKQVVGYMRFRHDAEGDFGRIRRQQQVIQTLSAQLKSPKILAKAASLIDAIHQYVQTDLTSDQQLALANLFHGMQQDKVVTAQLPIAGNDIVRGADVLIPDESKKDAMVDWIVRGDPKAQNRLIRVELRNASGDPDVYQQVYRLLRSEGFQVARAGRERGTAPTSRVVQHTNLRGAGRRVLETLGLSGTVDKDERLGNDVTLYVGKDLQGSSSLANAEMLPEPEEHPQRREPAPVTVLASRHRTRSRHSRDEEPVRVRLRRTRTDEGDSATESPSDEPTHSDAPSGDTAVPPPSDKPGGE